MQTIALPLTEFHHPPGFEARGVATPFTSPLLAGARTRVGSKNGAELVVSNPSGGPGVYIMEWSGVRALCNPTVHDTMLFQRLAALPKIDPERLRAAALAVAVEGYAGKDAATAAQKTIEADRTQRLRAHFQLLAALMAQTDPDSLHGPLPPERTPEFDRRATNVLHRVSAALGCAAAHLATGLNAMGDAFAPIGLFRDDRNARIPRMLATTKDTMDQLAVWLDAAAPNDIGDLGRTVMACMAAAREIASELLAAAHAGIADPAWLLKHWVENPDQAIARASRCGWVLDGWEWLCLLWRTAASDAERRAVLLEMAQALPVMPREVLDWTGHPVPETAMNPAVRIVSQNDAWRRGAAAFFLIQRNETLRAMSA